MVSLTPPHTLSITLCLLQRDCADGKTKTMEWSLDAAKNIKQKITTLWPYLESSSLQVFTDAIFCPKVFPDLNIDDHVNREEKISTDAHNIKYRNEKLKIKKQNVLTASSKVKEPKASKTLRKNKTFKGRILDHKFSIMPRDCAYGVCNICGTKRLEDWLSDIPNTTTRVKVRCYRTVVKGLMKVSEPTTILMSLAELKLHIIVSFEDFRVHVYGKELFAQIEKRNNWILPIGVLQVKFDWAAVVIY
jgi:hypothetical protein